jgi:gluconokinase
MTIVVMGVAGAGKSTVGSLLANALGWTLVDADSFHSPANIEKMSHGIPLSDADRAPWLEAIHERIVHASHSQENVVIACSALKQRYRDVLANGVTIQWVYLKSSMEQIRERLLQRRNHFMNADLLASQFADLEEPQDAIVADSALPAPVVVRQIMDALRRRTPQEA